MKRVVMMVVLIAALWPLTVQADEREVNLYAPPDLVATGLIKHIGPRFSFKHQVRVVLVDDPATADVVLGPQGRALFEGIGQVWRLKVNRQDHMGTDRFADWLTSEVGKKTVAGFAPDGTALFGAPSAAAPVVAEITYDGNAELGLAQAQAKCARCHAVEDQTRFGGIGSTPSFGVLRSLTDWEERFTAFYALNPHPSFTQIEDVSEPFPINRPSPIIPIEMTLDEVDHLLAYVAAMAPADLGGALVID